jgi:hypothetical protein
MWNKFKARWSGHNRTNICEGYNNAFSLCLPTNASVRSIIDQFRNKESKAERELGHATRGNGSPEVTNSCNLGHQNHEAELQALVNNFSDVPLKVYMDSIISFFLINLVDSNFKF